MERTSEPDDAAGRVGVGRPGRRRVKPVGNPHPVGCESVDSRLSWQGGFD